MTSKAAERIDEQCLQCAWLRESGGHRWCEVFLGPTLPPPAFLRHGTCTARLTDAEKAAVIRVRMELGVPVTDLLAVRR